MASEAEIRAALVERGLGERVDAILGLSRACVEIRPRAGSLEELRLGASRIGGLPDLPPDVPWPRWKDEPQSLIAQIALSDLRGVRAPDPLPAAGLLSFFYSARQDTWGFDPADRGSWSVLHTPEGAALERRGVPAGLPPEALFRACPVDFDHVLTLPPWDSPLLEGLGLSDAEVDAYLDAMEAAVRPVHQIGGHPDQVQNEMTLECQLVSNGLDLGDGSAWSDPRVETLRPGAEEWRLLLQVGSDELPRMMWGDAGFLYFWIRERDLARGSFDDVWTILQCH